MDLGPGRRSRRLFAAAALAAAALTALFLAAAAVAEVRSGSATDPLESSRVDPGEDIVAVSASYDTAGTLGVAVTTAAPPPTGDPLALAVGFGTLQGSECAAPVALVLSEYSEIATASWSFGSLEGPASKSIVGGTTTLAATAPSLANQPFNCVEPFIFDTSGPEPILVEGLASTLVLTGPPPAAPAPPPSSPQPAPTLPPPAPKLAKLALAPAKALTLRRGKWKQVKVKITNAGTATAAKVWLTLGKAKGVAVKPKSGKLELKSIAPGKSKSVSFKLRLTKKAKATSKIALKLTGAKGLKASGTLTVQAWKKPRKDKGPANSESPLAETLFYGYETLATESARLIGYAFIDDTWAYNGIPAGGLPNCTAVTGSAEKEGCVKYSYDPKSRELRIGSLSGKLTVRGALEIDGEVYSPTYIPPAGTTYQVEQEYVGYYGLCGLVTGCSTWHEHLLLTSSGEFVLSKQSLISVGGSGSGVPFVAAGNFPPDQHGTYAIEPRGRIKLSFADGSVQTKTIAILLNPEGKPDPVNEGLLLDSSYFIFLPED